MDRGSNDGVANDSIGITSYIARNDNQQPHYFASAEARISDATDGAEEGRYSVMVAAHSAPIPGLSLEGNGSARIDATIANGTNSTTTIAGTLTMGSTAALTNTGLVAVANQSNITGLGTISSGVWNGTDVTVANGGTGVSTLGADAVLIGAGTGAITSSTNLTFDDTDLSLAGAGKMEFRDAAIYIQSSADGQLDLVADTTIDVTAPTVEINSSTKLDVNANELDMDLTDSSNITITSSEAAEDLTIEQVGANDSSIIIQAAGTGADAIKLNATAGSIDIDSGDNITVNAADDITIAAAGGDITISTADTYGTKITAREFTQPGTSANDRKECDITYAGGQGTIALGDLVYMHTDGRWNRTDANAVATATGLLGIALGSNVSDSGVVLRGMYTLDHNLGDDQNGRPLYLSGTVAQATFTAPSDDGDVVRIIGYQLGNANEIWFNPDNTWVELG